MSGVLSAILALTNLVMRGPNGSLTVRAFAPRSTAENMALLALAAGACMIAAGGWSSRNGKSWLLVLHGLALSAFGSICFSTTHRVSFAVFAALLIVMAASIGILALATALTLRRHVVDQWLLALAGVASVGFAAVFVALALRWIQPERPESLFIWMGSYFAFSAVSTLALALRLNRLR